MPLTPAGPPLAKAPLSALPSVAPPSPAERAPLLTGRIDSARAPATVAANIVPMRRPPPLELDDIEAPAAGLPAPGPAPSARTIGAPPRRKAEAAPAPAPASRDTSRFGARDRSQARRVGGKPRFLGLILTALLLGALALAAWWAGTLDTGLARWLGLSNSGTEIVAVPDLLPPTGATRTATAQETTSFALTDPATGSGPGDLDADPGVLAALPDPAPDAQTPAVLAAPLGQTDAIAALAPESAALVTPGALISPAEAERIYAATGVWLRAPRLPLLPRAEGIGQPLRARPDARPGPSLSLVAAPAAGPDAGLPPQPLPPPPGTVFARDARGLILATPEGTLMPSGVMVFAGAPTAIPPARPGTPVPEPPPQPPPEPAPEPPPEPTLAAATAFATLPSVTLSPFAIRPMARPAGLTAASPALAPDPAALTPALPTLRPVADSPFRIRPVLRPAAFVVPAVAGPAAAPATQDFAPLPSVVLSPFRVRPLTRPPGLAPSAAPTAPQGTAPTPGAVAFDGLRPAIRPQDLAAGRPPPVQTGFTGARPPARPEGLAPVPAVDPALAAPQPPVEQPDVNAALAAILAAGPDPLASATAAAIPQAPRPDMRPRNFDRVVARAQDQLARAAAPAAAPGGVGTAALQDPGGDEPDPASDAVLAPNGPIPGGVAQAATFENAIALRDINLIGVFGPDNDRQALVRLANGRYVRVGVGDNLDGGRVAAIGTNELAYVQRGRTVTLEMPGG